MFIINDNYCFHSSYLKIILDLLLACKKFIMWTHQCCDDTKKLNAGKVTFKNICIAFYSNQLPSKNKFESSTSKHCLIDLQNKYYQSNDHTNEILTVDFSR